MVELTFELGIGLIVFGCALIGAGYYLGRKVAPLHVMIYFMAVFAIIIGVVISIPNLQEDLFQIR